MIWYQRSGKRPPNSRTPCGISSYGSSDPESTKDGIRKKTETKTACAESRASDETNTPMPSVASMKGSAPVYRTRTLPAGQNPYRRPAATIATVNPKYPAATVGTSLPITTSSGEVGCASICS